MKIAISSDGKGIKGEISNVFGRCKYFLIIEADKQEIQNVEAIENTSVQKATGAGIQAAQMVAKIGAGIVITGNIGPNAFQTLTAAGVKVITGVNGSVKDVVDKFSSGEFKEIDAPSVASHFGMGDTGRGRNL